MELPSDVRSFVLINTNEALLTCSGFLLGLENLEKWEGIFQSGNFEQTGKVRENHTKYWKIEGISEKIICYFSMIFK